ncbi:MAG: pseudouridine synthase [Bacteroidales bacterium]|jgi:23S rRNA pseudouridine2605 synthase|nr:pseudouridine synthase [Bacteroidales bacterium]
MEETQPKRSFDKTRAQVEEKMNRRSEGTRSYSDRDSTRDSAPRRSYGGRNNDGGQRRNFGGRSNDSSERRSYGFRNSEGGERRSYGSRNSEGGERRSYGSRNSEGGERRSYGSRSNDGGAPRRNYRDRNDDSSSGRQYRDRDAEGRTEESDRPKRRNVTAESPILSEIVDRRIREGRQAPQKPKILSLEYEELHGPIRLNKYISNSGICSRRDADVLISTGAITVNDQIVTELGTKVNPTDEVRYGDKVLQREKPVYLLLNKPKDYITTTYDEKDRKDVMELVRGACPERVYPVGRLDKNTTGVLLFTNDGEMAKKLTHPENNIKKTYLVELDKPLTAADFDTIVEGLELEDGVIKSDDLAYVNDSKVAIGITIHSGKNRIVRRIFAQLGYDVLKLDRVSFAGLDKKNVLRGKWRFLSQQEVNFLKML